MFEPTAAARARKLLSIPGRYDVQSDTSEQTREAALTFAVKLTCEAGVAGATLTRTVGVWNGVTESGFTLEILHPILAILTLKVESIASDLTAEFNQEAVLVSFVEVERAVLVSANGDTEAL